MNSVSKRCAKYLSEICASIICLSRAQAQHGNMICWEYACFHLPQQIVTRGNKLAEIKRLRLSFPLMRGWRYLFLAKWKYLQKNCLSFFFFFIPVPPSARNFNVYITFHGVWEEPCLLFPFFPRESSMEEVNLEKTKLIKKVLLGGRKGALFPLKHYLQETTRVFQTTEVFLPVVCCSVLFHRDKCQLIPWISWHWPWLSQPSTNHDSAIEQVSWMVNSDCLKKQCPKYWQKCFYWNMVL